MYKCNFEIATVDGTALNTLHWKGEKKMEFCSQFKKNNDKQQTEYAEVFTSWHT